MTLKEEQYGIELLKNCSHTIPILAEWIYDEWRSYDSSLTKEKLINRFHKRLNEDKLPLTLVTLKNGIPVGTVSLKEEDEAEFKNLSDGEPWLGSLQVVLEERNRGLGHELLKAAQTFAIRFGYKNIFLYTSNPANLEWYYKRGARFIETRPFRNHTITIMQIPLAYRTTSRAK